MVSKGFVNKVLRYQLDFGTLNSGVIWADNEEAGCILEGLVFGLRRGCRPRPCSMRLDALHNNVQRFVN